MVRADHLSTTQALGYMGYISIGHISISSGSGAIAMMNLALWGSYLTVLLGDEPGMLEFLAWLCSAWSR